MSEIRVEAVAACLSRHTQLYQRRPPIYQTVMLNDLASLWVGRPDRIIDLGGGTGVIAQAIQEFLPVGKVISVDIVDRYFKTITVETSVYDGSKLPFDAGSFDAATINNVMHHIPPELRSQVLREIRRVVAGPVYIKDHVAVSWLDKQRLSLLDAIGNIPFSGQIEAWYLTADEWQLLARQGGYTICASKAGRYRSGIMATLFPNRLETTMRFEPM